LGCCIYATALGLLREPGTGSKQSEMRIQVIDFLGIPLEFIRRLEISTASVAILAFTEWEVQVRCLNARLGVGGQSSLFPR
jgi:hypothetical protein